jgi:hypothetical protein
MYGMQSHCGTLASNTRFFLFVTSHANFYWPYEQFIVFPAPAGFFGVKSAIPDKMCIALNGISKIDESASHSLKWSRLFLPESCSAPR